MLFTPDVCCRPQPAPVNCPSATSNCSKCKQLLLVTLHPWDHSSQVFPAQLLHDGGLVLTLGQHFGSSAPGCQSLAAGWKLLLSSRDWLSLQSTWGTGDRGWDVSVLHRGTVWVQKKSKRIITWEMIVRGIWMFLKSFVFHPYLMCLLFVWCDMSAAWVVWNLCGCFSKYTLRDSSCHQATCKAALTVFLPILAVFPK